MNENDKELERLETRDWLQALDEVLERSAPERVERLLRALQARAARAGVALPYAQTSAYVNSIAPHQQPRFPGDLQLERKLENLVRYNAMAIVVRANRRHEGIGGHISSFASAATLFEVGFNHFFRGADHPEGPDQLYLQGHASPGVYARAYLEGRLSEAQLDNFRRELQPGGGLSSYPHPWLMPDFWEFPTVSMGLAPMMAVYQARFNHYLQQRGLTEHTSRVWALIGDGEMDEPESMGAVAFAGREGLSNLVFVIDCNLQRLDGPVRGNSKIIQELESLYRGAGWRVIKVLWGSEWDELFERDRDGLLVERLDRTLDGEMQRYNAAGGAYLREHLFGADPRLAELVERMSDDELSRLRRGGHDIEKVYAAYQAAEQEAQRPTVILAQTVKGFGLGKAGEGLNIAHKTKTLNEEQLAAFRDRFDLPIGDDQLGDVAYFRPAPDSQLARYLRARREDLGGAAPARKVRAPPLQPPSDEVFQRFFQGSGERPATTTMVTVRLLTQLLKDDALGKLIVPIIPDEARTFGLEALFPTVGIYAKQGQSYEPVDVDALLTYREAKTGQLLEEGITEAGSMSSTIAAGTAYATHGINTVPFFFFYSMFGFQRIGDLIWAAQDSRARGFLIGATSGRTALNGEGLQHQDGHSHLIAYTHPAVRAYDTTFGYEIASIVQDGLKRMYADGESVIYYLTVANEPYQHPEMPRGVREGILKGLYRYRRSQKHGEVRRAQILASGPAFQQALKAQSVLEDRFGVTTDVWSVTSYKALYDDAQAAERHNYLHPQEDPRVPYLAQCLGEDPGAVVAVSDFVRALPYSLARWMPGSFIALGTDGFGRSDSREALRDFFEIDHRYVVLAALSALARADRYPTSSVAEAVEELGIDPDKANPMFA